MSLTRATFNEISVHRKRKRGANDRIILKRKRRKNRRVKNTRQGKLFFGTISYSFGEQNIRAKKEGEFNNLDLFVSRREQLRCLNARDAKYNNTVFFLVSIKRLHIIQECHY